MIPELIDIGAPLKVLPPGIYDATLDEVEKRFAISSHRKHLFSGFKQGVTTLRKAGCRVLYLDGSFITEKVVPKDYDVCWDPIGVDVRKLDPVFLDFSNNREKQKKVYCGEYFPAHFLANGTYSFYDFFQTDKDTRKPKGIIRICLT